MAIECAGEEIDGKKNTEQNSATFLIHSIQPLQASPEDFKAWLQLRPIPIHEDILKLRVYAAWKLLHMNAENSQICVNTRYTKQNE